MQLNVKTRNNSTPQGKSRIYISCHPDNFDQYFSVLCDEIFATQNCAIYYAEERNADAETSDPEEYLSDMQIIVVPVTEKYLQDVEGVLANEYAYAMEHYIPVLPILMEIGALNLFAGCMNRIKSGYGDIQFLNRASKDTTEIAYAEKLKNRLESILTEDELAERVRAAFDAYIFLSYRKKDRVYAKELMRLIHRIPYCQDIAIWYDEYLVPGELWDDSIATALAKSSLVTMAITPNIIEGDNFVIRKEYPDAVALGKKVVPVEMKPTDRESLSAFFEGLSMPVNGHSLEDLTEALRSLAVETNDTSPDHQFLIGLAYLGGIDVERDPDRAVRLITQAAEANLPEAMEKLVTMYENGNGVCRDYTTAIQWQKKYVDLLEQLEDSKFGRELRSLGILQGNSGYHKDEFETMTRLVKFTEKEFAKEDKYSSVRICNVCISYMDLGAACEAVGGLEEKRHEFYRKAFQFIEPFAEDKEYGSKIDIKRCYADSCYKLATVGLMFLSTQQFTEIVSKNLVNEYERQDWSFRKKYYKKAINMYESIAEETLAESDYMELSKIYIDFAGMAPFSSERSLQRELIVKSVKLCEKWVNETDSYQARRGLCWSYDNFANISEGHQDKINYYKKSIALQERIVEESGSSVNLEVLAHLYATISICYREKENFDDAKMFLLKEADLREKICDMTGACSKLKDLAWNYYKRAKIFLKLGELDNAKNHYDAGLRLEERFASGENASLDYVKLARQYEDAGDAFRDVQDYDNAIEYHKKYVEYNIQFVREGKEKYEQIHSSDTRSTYISARWTLCDSYIKLGELYQKAGDYSKAEEAYLKGQQEHEGTMAESVNSKPYNTAHAYKRLSIRYCNMGDMCLTDNRPEDAEKYYRKSLEAAALIQPVFPNLDMSFFQEIREKYAKLPKEILHADPLRKKNLLKKLEETDAIVVIMKAYLAALDANGNKPFRGPYTVGVIAYAKGDFKEALSHFEEMAQEGSLQAQFNLGVMYRYGLGTTKDIDKALSLFEKFLSQLENKPYYNYKFVQDHAVQQCISIVCEQAESKKKSEAIALFDHGNTLFDRKVYHLGLSFYEQSANEGCKEAMYNCGIVYLQGKGVKADYKISLDYFNKAYAAGLEQSKEPIAYLKKKMRELQSTTPG